MQERLVDYFIFLSTTSFQPILENAQFEIPILIYVLNADNPFYRLFHVTSCSCLHLLFIPSFSPARAHRYDFYRFGSSVVFAGKYYQKYYLRIWVSTLSYLLQKTNQVSYIQSLGPEDCVNIYKINLNR